MGMDILKFRERIESQADELGVQYTSEFMTYVCEQAIQYADAFYRDVNRNADHAEKVT